MAMPLDGIRVLDWTIWQQGPIATSMLADMGADVIKIEQTGVGDPGRYLFAAGGAQAAARPNWYFESHNRNKRGITLDFSKPAGRAVLYDLVKHADVFVQNFRHGVAGRLGLDYATLSALNPKLIYGSATGYGPRGSETAEPSFDHLGLARSGIMNAAGEPDMPPLGIAGGIADQMGGVMLAWGIVNALYARERHGIGQEVNASHLGSMLFLQGLSVSMKLMAGVAFPRTFRARAGNPLWNHYRCADGKWIAFAMLQSDRYWPDFARVIGRPELAADERFKDLTVRAKNSAECVAIIDAAMASKPRDEWIRILQADSGDYIYTIVNSVDDLPSDPQVLANGYVTDLDHPQYGKTKVVGIPVELTKTPGRVRTAAPELGQNTEEILMDLLGYDWEKISALREQKVI
jgi:crotonobetainyl-CoA:carnitine CoA-transferase CaiB-like acyl-CoA transferase